MRPLQPPVQAHVKVGFLLAAFSFAVLIFLALPATLGMMEDNFKVLQHLKLFKLFKLN